MSLYQVRLNFVHRLESISPTFTKLNRGFRCVDRLRMGGEADDAEAFGNSSGRARDFVVIRSVGLPDSEDAPSSLTHRASWHEYEVSIAYPTALGLENDLHEAADQDRHQIIEALRHKSTYTGIPGATSTSVGLKKRIYMGDELQAEGPVWVMRYRFDCQVWEDTV